MVTILKLISDIRLAIIIWFSLDITTLQPFNSLFSRTTWVSRYQKGKTNLEFTGARDSEWQWHQLGHMQVCTSLQTLTTPVPHHGFSGRMPFLPPNQQHQSTDGTLFGHYWYLYSKWTDYTKYLKYINGQQRLRQFWCPSSKFICMCHLFIMCHRPQNSYIILKPVSYTFIISVALTSIHPMMDWQSTG